MRMHVYMFTDLFRLKGCKLYAYIYRYCNKKI